MEKHKLKRFAVVGGDLRQISLANHLAQSGFSVTALGFDDSSPFSPLVTVAQHPHCLSSMDVVIFPLPVTSEPNIVNAPFFQEPLPLDQCLRRIPHKAAVFGGKISPQEAAVAQGLGLAMEDYLHREEMAVLNAVPTAEGAIELAMNELPVTLWRSRCLITGFGRVGKVLAPMLLALGAQVTVAARKEADLAWAKVIGCQTARLKNLAQAAKGQDVIYNTVPSLLFNEETLKHLEPSCLLIDLASKPGGVDMEAAKNLGIRTIWALSIPGKVAPITAADIIKDTILNMLEERSK